MKIIFEAKCPSRIALLTLLLLQASCGRVWPGRFPAATDTGRVAGNIVASLTSGETFIADGLETTQIRVKLRSSGGAGTSEAAASTVASAAASSPVVGVVPVLEVSGNGNTILCSPSDQQGVSLCALSSVEPGTKTITVLSPVRSTNTASVEALETTSFRYTWNAPGNDPTATLPLRSTATYNIRVYWGDGNVDTITDPMDPAAAHTYAREGDKTIIIAGNFTELMFSSNPDRLKDVTYWGSQEWTSMAGMFKGCTGITSFSATQIPNTSQVTSFENMFDGATNFNSPIGAWNTSAATSMARMFRGAVSFDSPIGAWDVSNVRDFSEMFSAPGLPASEPALLAAQPALTTTFNQPLNSWNTSNARFMNRMFAGNIVFNQDISNWNTSLVSNMSHMFYYAKAFNQDLPMTGSAWNVSQVTDMSGMFFRAEAFNGNISNWTPNALSTMQRMFAYALVFNRDLLWGGAAGTPNLTSLHEAFYTANAFNGRVEFGVSKVTTFYRCFMLARAFNQSVATWFPGSNVGASAVNMISMFDDARAFNQPVNHFGEGMAQVTSVAYMFRYAQAFNQPLNLWNVQASTGFEFMFAYTNAFNQDLSSWNTGNGRSFYYTFHNAAAFNNGGSPGTVGPALTWNTAAATNMVGMFWSAVNFNAPLPAPGWNTSQVTSFYAMFTLASAFNQSVSHFDVSNATSTASMFYGASAFNQNLDGWDTSRVTTMARMFLSASNFNNGDAGCGVGGGMLGGGAGTKWVTAAVTDMSRMFESATCFNKRLPFDTGQVTTMASMFKAAENYNQPMASWNTANVSNMASMFSRATSFNVPLRTWNVASVTDFSYMFYMAHAFNQDLGSSVTVGWDTRAAVNMNYMFQAAITYNQNLFDWNVSRVTSCTLFDDQTPATWTSDRKPLLSCSGSVPKKFFLTESLTMGNFNAGGTGTSLADVRCHQDLKYPGTGTYRALIGIAGSRSIDSQTNWPLLANQAYLRIDGTGAFTTDASKRVVSPFGTAFGGSVTSFWTGLNADGTVATDNCSDFKTGSVNSNGFATAMNAWTMVTTTCDQLRPILCVEQ